MSRRNPVFLFLLCFLLLSFCNSYDCIHNKLLEDFKPEHVQVPRPKYNSI